MKIWLLLLLVASTSSAQPLWPHNQKTGYIEFKGTLPWPAQTKTSSQREALLQRWYQTKLLDSMQIESASPRTLNRLLRTYGSVTARGHLKYQRQAHLYQLNYTLKLVPAAKGLVYHVWDFSYAEGEGDASVSFDLESAIKDNRADNAVLAMFRRRIMGAITRW